MTRTSGASLAPKIAVDGSAVYVVWNDDTPGNDEIFFRKSADGGITWQAAQRLTSNAGASVSPAIAVDGTDVYVAWADSTPGIPQVYIKKSGDGGDHWQAARALSKNTRAGADHPALAVVGADVFVVWHDDDKASGGHGSIMFRKSVDGGATWRVAVALSEASSSADALNPAVAAAGSRVFVAWETNEPGNKEIYIRTSTNQGAGWQAARRVTQDSVDSSRPALAALGSNLYLVWEDATLGNSGIFFRKSANRGATWLSEARLTKKAGPIACAGPGRQRIEPLRRLGGGYGGGGGPLSQEIDERRGRLDGGRTADP